MKSGEYEEVKSGSSLLQSAKQSECANAAETSCTH